ncbi:F0F1 ATP synthase subunit B family protein [Nocardia sp. NPDC003482]
MNHTVGIVAAGPYQITFDWPVFFSQLFAFAVIVFAIWKWVVPIVKRLMVRNQEAIRKQLEESDQATQRLTDAKAAYDNAMAEAQSELERMRVDARADAEHIVAQMREAAATEVERVRKQGRDQILQLRRQLIRDLQTDLTAAMLDRTEEKVRVKIDNPEARSESIERFLEELEILANGEHAVRRQPQSRWN